MDPSSVNSSLSEQVVVELLEDLYRRFSLDFRNYSHTFIARRIISFARKSRFDSIEELVQSILNNDKQLESFVDSLSLPTTRMFRDPEVFRLLRDMIIPSLVVNHLSKVWSAGCSTGEEAYSLSIVLKEELPERKILTFATDLSEHALYTARKGIYKLRRMRTYTSGYIAAGGKADFSNYYTADHENAIMNEELKRSMVFAQHNLVTDSSFNEFDLILCRNVLIYFNRLLQAQVVTLLMNSLRPGGVLILGDKESISSMSPRKNLVELDRTYRIYRKT